MKLVFTLLAAIAMSLAANAQKAYSISKDEETGQTIFKGPITLSDLSAEPTFTWMKRSADAYTADATAVAYLKEQLPAYHIVAIMGTWCDDSQNLIPKLAKVLNAAQFPMDQYAMWGVDRAKQTGGVESKRYDVKRVPTIILFKGDKEVGRIVESISRSIESDMVQMIRKG